MAVIAKKKGKKYHFNFNENGLFDSEKNCFTDKGKHYNNKNKCSCHATEIFITKFLKKNLWGNHKKI